jgi:predicted Rossmann fold nucleotide-binding protein DprA/Smf involved in DNA uptake
MNLAVVGSRTFSNYEYMHFMLTEILYSYWVWKCTIISGGARGADQLAERFAKEDGHDISIFPAEWDKYGKSAGYKRNKLIVDNADIVAAFWDGESKGTLHTMNLARKQGKPLYIFTDWKSGTIQKSSNTVKTNNV